MCNLLNQQRIAQEFVLVIQIVDGHNIAQQIALIRGSIEKGQIKELSHDWTAEEASNYEVQILVLDNIDNSPVMFAEKISKRLLVSQ